MNRMHLAITAATIATAAPALAQSNVAAPVNPVFSLTGQQQSTDFTRYSFSFVAADPVTNLTFALRNDPFYIRLDDVSLTTGGGVNLLTNGGFEDGPFGGSAPAGWTYLNEYGANAGGVVSGNGARTGSLGYYDGAVGAYDAITQAVTTTVGTTYDVSFWAAVNSIGGTGLYQEQSDNGATGSSGNGIDLFAYAASGTPVLGDPTAPVPEPASWGLMILGIGVAGATARRRQRVSARVTYA